MLTKEQLIRYADDNEVTIPKSYRIKINGKFVAKRTYRGTKRIWSTKSAVKQAIQLILNSDTNYQATNSTKSVNSAIEEYLASGFIEIVEV